MQGVHAKFERAVEQTSSLTADIHDFCEAQKQLIHHYRDSKRQIWRFEGETPVVPLEYSVRAGEIVHNLRSALDHFVWQLVLANGENPGRWNGYPIHRDQSAYRQAANGMLKGVSDRAKQAIELHQPFHCYGNAGYNLWLLHMMSRQDKHRTFSGASAVLNGANIIVERAGADGTGGFEYPGALEKGRTLLRIDDPDEEDRVDFHIEVRFMHSGSRQPSWRDTFPSSYEEGLKANEEYGAANHLVVRTLEACVRDVHALLGTLYSRIGLPVVPPPLVLGRVQGVR